MLQSLKLKCLEKENKKEVIKKKVFIFQKRKNSAFNQFKY